jgi:D-alanyl-D-alanine carboxypeptidase
VRSLGTPVRARPRRPVRRPGRPVRARRLTVALLACALAAACAGSPEPDPPTSGPPVGEATSSSGVGARGRPQPPDSDQKPAKEGRTPEGGPVVRASGTWRVGVRPLPLRPDGFGQVRPTPAPLRTRRLPTLDRLPAPPGGRFRSSIRPIGPAVRARMGATWKPGCPVGLGDLRYVTVSFRGFDGRAHTGELVVHERVAAGVVSVFARLYRARFPIEEMRLVTGADLEAHPTGDGNNTAAFVCRAARKQTRWSAHAYGLAVDVNPFQNPYRRGDLVLPELAGAYLDRTNRRPGMVRPGDAVTAAFADLGWTWGGTWRSPRDYMHFSATGG